MENNTWFYIQSTRTKDVISASRYIQSEGMEALRSKVHVYTPLQTDEELWTWEGQFIRNKATGLVLDIRKGRLRLIEDTEICLYSKKGVEKASNQLWGMSDSSIGKRIYSISNSDWTLMQDGDKLLLYPQEPLPEYDTWDCIGEQDLLVSTPQALLNDTSGSTWSLSSSFETEYTQGGLSPAKRGSQGSVTLYSMDTFKDYHDRLYLEKDPHLSDKAISMAVAYHSWVGAELSKIELQNQAEQQALNLLSWQPYQDKETILHLTNRYINLLIDHKVPSS